MDPTSYTSCVAFMLLPMVLATTVAQPAKKVTIGHPTSTQTTMMGAGIQVHDSVKKVIEPLPDSHRTINQNYKETMTITENLKTPAKGTNEGHIQVVDQFSTTEDRNVDHKNANTLTTTKIQNHGGFQTAVHRQITEKNKNEHTDVVHSCETCKKVSRSVNEGKDSVLVKSREERGEFSTHALNAEKHIHGKTTTDNNDKQETSFRHETQQQMGTVQTVHDGHDNVMAGEMHDVHTETISGKQNNEEATNQQVTPQGQLTQKKTIQGSSIVATDVQKHYMNAYHDTPLHKFMMKNEQVRDDRFKQQSLDAELDTELKRKDGVKVNTHMQKKINIDASRLQHVDELMIRAVTKAHPEQPTEVKLQTKIVDRDHVVVNQSDKKNEVTTMPDGGKRTVSVREEKIQSKDLKTTPIGGSGDGELRLAEQVQRVEKTVVPAQNGLMTPLVHHYKMVKMPK